MLLITAENARLDYFVKSGIVFLNDFTVLLLIFAPKFLAETLGIGTLTSTKYDATQGTTVSATSGRTSSLSTTNE